MPTINDVLIHEHRTRRNAFGVPPEKRPMPSKTLATTAERIMPSVSPDIARLADHLTQNPVFVDLIAALRAEAVAKLTTSALGPDGATMREVARYELEAISALEGRLVSMAAENTPEDETA